MNYYFESIANSNFRVSRTKWYSGNAYFPVTIFTFEMKYNGQSIFSEIELIENETHGYSNFNYSGSFNSANKFNLTFKLNLKKELKSDFRIEFRKGLAELFKFGRKISVRSKDKKFKEFINGSDAFNSLHTMCNDQRYFLLEVIGKSSGSELDITFSGMLPFDKDNIEKSFDLSILGAKRIIDFYV